MQNQEQNSTQQQQTSEEYVSGKEFREQMQEFQKTPAPLERQITWKQKLAVVFLIIFGISAMILWAVQFMESLRGDQTPITESETDFNSLQDSLNNLQVDTDGDGLTDYDEINSYNTSPYLEDTDSDGLSDSREIELGDDPNCPQGQQCNGADSDVKADTNQQTQDFLQENSLSESDLELLLQLQEQSEQIDSEQVQGDILPSDVLQQSTTGGEVGLDANSLDQNTIQSVLGGDANAQTLRIIMQQAGIDSSLLDQVSDEDLMKIYSQNTQ